MAPGGAVKVTPVKYFEFPSPKPWKHEIFNGDPTLTAPPSAKMRR